MPKLLSIAEAFAIYRAGVIPSTASDIQVRECQRAFVGGAYSLLMDALLNIGADATSEEEGVAQLEALRHECEAFAQSVGTPAEGVPVVRQATEAEQFDALQRELRRRGRLADDVHHDAPRELVADIRPLLERLGHQIGDDLPPGWGFTLFLFSFGPNGHTFYIANAERADMLVLLKEFIARQTS